MVVSVPEFLGFYGPLLGLIGVSFWLGKLTQTVSSQAKEIDKIRAEALQRAKELEERIEEVRSDGGADVNRIVRLEVQMEHMTRSNEAIARGMEGIQRQFANIIQQGFPRPFRVAAGTDTEG